MYSKEDMQAGGVHGSRAKCKRNWEVKGFTAIIQLKLMELLMMVLIRIMCIIKLYSLITESLCVY